MGNREFLFDIQGCKKEEVEVSPGKASAFKALSKFLLSLSVPMLLALDAVKRTRHTAIVLSVIFPGCGGNGFVLNLAPKDSIKIMSRLVQVIIYYWMIFLKGVSK